MDPRQAKVVLWGGGGRREPGLGLGPPLHCVPLGE